MANKDISIDLKPIISQSRLLSIEWKHGFINYDHLFVAMLKNKCEASVFLSQCDTAIWEEKIKNTYPANGSQTNKGNIPFTIAAERALKHAFTIVNTDNQQEINSVHLLLAILSFDNDITQALNKAGILIEDITTASFKKAIKRFPLKLKPFKASNYTRLESFFLSKRTKRKIISKLFRNATDQYQYSEFDDSIKTCLLGLSLMPEYSEFKTLLAYNYYYLRDYDAALSLIKELPNTNKENPQLLFFVSYILDKTGKHDEAAGILDRLLSEEPDNPAYLNNRGFNLFRRGRYRESIPFFEKTIQQDPQCAYAFNNLGFAKYKLGEIDAGAALINKSLDLDKGNSFAYKHKGIIAMDLGNNPEAKRYLELALKYGYSEKYGEEAEKLLAALGA